jgi:peptide/nickel transport system permease protein
MTAQPDTATTPVAIGERPLADNRLEVATPRQLMWWRFRKHKVAVASAIVLLLFYLAALLAPFLATAGPPREKPSAR